MKREYREAIARAIKESDLNGYKWTIIENGLRWSYLDEEFTFDTASAENILAVRDSHGHTFVYIWHEQGKKYADCETLTEAYYIATKAAIKKANYVY